MDLGWTLHVRHAEAADDNASLRAQRNQIAQIASESLNYGINIAQD